jgi:hypothetical protein
MNESAANGSSPATGAVWKQRYEALRQLAAGGQQILEAEPLGLVLVLREGVAGWMRGWSALAQTPPLRRASTAPAVAAAGCQQQLTEVLAAMSLAHLPNQAI